MRPSLRSSPLLGGQSVVHSHKVGPSDDSVKNLKTLLKMKVGNLRFIRSPLSLYTLYEGVLRSSDELLLRFQGSGVLEVNCPCREKIT